MAEKYHIKSLTVEELFELKSKFLRDIPHPKLIFKAIKSIDRDAALPAYGDLNVEGDLSQVLERYSKVVLELKFRITQSKSSEELLAALNELLYEQMYLILGLSAYVPDDILPKFADVKQSGAIDYYLVKKWQSTLENADNKIKDYLCTQFNAHKNGEEVKALLVPFVRAKKIVQNG